MQSGGNGLSRVENATSILIRQARERF